MSVGGVGGTTGSLPSWVKLLCAAIAAIGWLETYLAPMFPRVAYVLLGVQGTVLAFGLYLGWPVPTVTTSPPPAPS